MAPVRRLLLLAALVAACADEEPEGYRVRGSLLDGETGEPVSRATFYVHAFHDATDHQVSLDPADPATFEMVMPAAEVRLRIADKSRRYRLYEERHVLHRGDNELDVRLEPTHFVRLHGRVLDADTGEPLERTEGIGGDARLHVRDEDGKDGIVTVPDEDGSYSVRVPRHRLRFRFVNTGKGPVEPTLDLSGYEGDAFEHDILMR